MVVYVTTQHAHNMLIAVDAACCSPDACCNCWDSPAAKYECCLLQVMALDHDFGESFCGKLSAFTMACIACTK